MMMAHANTASRYQSNAPPTFYGVGPSSSGLRFDPSAPIVANFTAATHSNTAHPSGWKATIHLDREGRSPTRPGSHWRSGEVIKGAVELEWDDRGRGAGEPHAAPRMSVTSVIVRAYWQSTTFYTTFGLVEPPPPSGLFGFGILPPPAVTRETVSQTHAEWHRGFCLNGGEGTEVWDGGELEVISREVEGDFPGLESAERDDYTERNDSAAAAAATTSGDPSRSTLPFAFGLPITTQVTEASANSEASRRLLQQFRRTPPASLPSSMSRDGNVEWVVEVLVRLSDSVAPLSAPEPLPSFTADATPPFTSSAGDSARASPTLGHITSTPVLLVSRAVFPFEPSDHHSQELNSAWRPQLDGVYPSLIATKNGLTLDEVADPRPITGVVPGFGKDPRDEALGGTHAGPARALRGTLVDSEGGRAKWMTFEKRLALQNVFGTVTGWIRCQVAMPSPPITSRHAPSLPLLLHLDYPIPPSTSNRSLGKLKPIYLEKILLLLSRRILTRGGRGDERGTSSLFETRRVEVKLWDDVGGQIRTHLCLKPGGEGRDVRVDFDLQSEGVSPTGKPLQPLRDGLVSFRTPNIEVEYVLSATLQPIGHPCFFCIRAPVQVLAGDLDELPPRSPCPSPSPSATLPLPPPPPMETDGLPGYAEA